MRRDAELILGTASRREFERAAAALHEVRVARREDVDTRLERLELAHLGDSRPLARAAYLRVQSEIQLAAFVVTHFERQLVLSWRRTEMPDRRSGLVRFSDYPFTAWGWCWLRPLRRYDKAGKPKPALTVLDVFATDCELLDVESHLARIDRIRAVSERARDVLSIIAARRFAKDAWRRAQGAGLILVNLQQLFGNAALDLMAAVAPLLGPDEAMASPSDVDQNLQFLATSLPDLAGHPLVADLRSLGLEAVGAVLARNDGWEDVRLGVRAPRQETSREADVSGTRRGGSSILVVECKAHHREKKLDPDDVRRFFSETVPAHIDHARQRNSPVEECQAEMWTTGEVGEDAREAMTRVPMNRVVKPALRDRKALLAMTPRHLNRCAQLIQTIATPLD